MLSRTSAMTSCCWLAESAACSPARRPRRRCDSASQPPWRYCFIQRFTALGWTPNTRAASAWVIPSSTAWTARLRSAAWAAPGRDRASSFDMPRAYDIPLYLPAGVITAGVVVLMLTLLHRSRLQAALRQCAAGLASTLRPYRTASGRYSRLGTGRMDLSPRDGRASDSDHRAPRTVWSRQPVPGKGPGSAGPFGLPGRCQAGSIATKARAIGLRRELLGLTAISSHRAGWWPLLAAWGEPPERA